MPARYHVKTKPAAPRFFPVPRLSIIEADGCLGCVECVKRSACVYDVYRQRRFDPEQVVDTAEVACINCMRCVQECKKNILLRARNPEYSQMGDEYWRPELIASIWKQASSGSIPVSGAGYGGPFAGAGFDQMWTDMSEIVRPTRDGIHGREYISTVIELGRRASRLDFDDEGNMLTQLEPFVEIPIPLVLEVPGCRFLGESGRSAAAEAACSLQSLAVVDYADAVGALSSRREHLIVRFEPGRDDPGGLRGVAVVELRYRHDIAAVIDKLRSRYPNLVISVRVPLDECAAERAVELAELPGCGVVHLQAARDGRGLGERNDRFVTTLVREVHYELSGKSIREQLTVLISGGIAMAEHAAKIIACGADGVGVDTALLVAWGCRLCRDCEGRTRCPAGLDEIPVDWGAQRIINLFGSWHSQMIEVMGAMGLREVRRLRGELGRTLFLEDLERDSFGPIFGKRVRSLDEFPGGTDGGADCGSSVPLSKSGFSRAKMPVSLCPSRFRNQLGKFRVVRTAECIGCGRCAEVCIYGVHRRAGKRMLGPRSNLCRGPEGCRAEGRLCVDNCPSGALRVGVDPLWETFGDSRWPADLLVSTWVQAETGLPPEGDFEYRTGASGGGFDRISIAFPQEPPDGRRFKPEDVELSVPLNRRKDGREEVTIGLPIYGGGMSFGSISLTTMLARARAYGAFESFTCTGEGGYPDELKEYDDHVITQVATGLFGVREETIQRVRIVEFKYAQGAKPGLGGHLLGDKVTEAVARMRESVVGSALFSPFPFHSVYSVEDHKKHVDWIKQINPRALVSVKVSTPTDVDMVAVGSYYAGAHIIHLDGSYGGTGAAPEIAKKNIAMPIEYAIPKVHRFLQAEGVREKVTLVASGGLRTAWDVAKAIALGADAVVIGTAELVALECIRCGVCESGRGCPRGIATTDAELSAAFGLDWATQRLVNLFHSWSVQLQGILWRLGLRSVGQLVGRTDVLRHLDYDNAGVLDQQEVESVG